MDVFWHINEGQAKGLALLSPLLLFTRELSVWSPAHAVLEEAFHDKHTNISPSGFLDLVEQGHIKVCGREEWLTNGDHRRNDNWPGAAWIRDFDGRLLKLFEDDYNGAEKRVSHQPPERGYKVADQIIEVNDVKFEIAKELVEKELVPSGTLDRINRNLIKPDNRWRSEPELMAARELLRDAVNHEDARSSVRADLTVDFDLFSSAKLGVLADRKPANITNLHHQFSLDKLKEVIALAKSLSGRENEISLAKLREDKKERKFLWELLLSEREKRMSLFSQIGRGTPDKDFMSEILGSKIPDNLVQSVGLVSAAGVAIHAANKGINRRELLFGVAGLGVATFSPTRQLLERNSVIPEGDYSGPKWMSVFALGHDSPTRKELDWISNSIVEKLG